MAYLVVSYPTVTKQDFAWIQKYRKRNDSRYFSLVNPHFTFVFAVHDLEERTFVDEVEKLVKGEKKVEFEIKVATINQDDSKQYYHEFLVPDKGYSDITKLHDKLYSGAFAPYLRFDIDFIPHIGIGNSENPLTSKQRVDQLNAVGIYIKGSIDSLDIIEYKDGSLKTVKKLILN